MADNGKRYYWLKLQDGFFNSKRIKKLRKIAGGDTYTIIYLKMQLLAMKSGGILEYTGLESTFAEELALDLDEEPENVAVTVNYLLSCDLLETNDHREYFVPYAVMNTGSEGASAKRMRDLRERQALLDTTTVTLPSQSDGEKEIEIEKEKEKEKELYIAVVSYLNQRIGTNYRPSTTKTKTCIRARLEEGFTLEDFQTVIDKKANEWLGTEYEKYLRPETLFGTKFESYLNANIVKPRQQQGYNKQTKAEELEDFYNMCKEWSES
jgi:uncharacterized phage protein (TIGR02220 family)/predicted phage replisome organizer